MRTSLIDGARRAYLGAVRGIFNKADDSKKMQTVDARHLHNEQHPATERFQNYGFSSVPLPPDQDGKKAAETIAIFLNGNRSHPVVIAVDDRRHRPQNLKAGENIQYDDQGQQVHIARGGIAVTGGPKKLPVTITVGSSSIKVADGTITIKADTIVLDGTVKLGGPDANMPASMQGTIDSNGDTDVGGFATKVLLK